MTDFDSTAPASGTKDAEYLTRLQDYYADWKSISSYTNQILNSAIAYPDRFVFFGCMFGALVVAIINVVN